MATIMVFIIFEKFNCDHLEYGKIFSFINGSTKWDDYRFYHWAGIDYFCYFSHEYVTVPTLAWINAAHRHGVRVLGTLIFEGDAGRKRLEEILQSTEYMHSIADALVKLAQRCRFEGWLLNVECTLETADKVEELRQFVAYVTQRMHASVPQALVIWYDSIVENGSLSWQNELNERNKSFFDVSDGILLNYAWGEGHLQRSADAVVGRAEDMARIFVGIDVFARGQKAKFETNVVSR